MPTDIETSDRALFLVEDLTENRQQVIQLTGVFMAAVAITSTAQNITGDFDLVVRGNPTDERVTII